LIGGKKLVGKKLVGIKSYGAYIPIYRLSNDEIARAWGTPSWHGEKAVSNFDEDSITMAVEAGIDCLEGLDRTEVDGLFLATTTSPYKEKLSAATVAMALDLRTDIRTACFAESLRSGTTALGLAIDAVKSGSSRNVLVIATDCRLAAPNSQYESHFGDGAAAVLIGNSQVIASAEVSCSSYNEMLDVWRGEHNTFVQAWEDRFILDRGYQESIYTTVSMLMKKHGVAPKDFTKVILYASNTRMHATLARRLGFDMHSQVQDPLLDTVGNTGAASVLMMVVAALEEAKPGDSFLVASYGDGCDAFTMRVGVEIRNVGVKRGVKQHVASKIMLSNYEKYLAFRGIIPVYTPLHNDVSMTSPVALWRERRKNIAFYGAKCKQCGNVQYPPQKVCVFCQAEDQFEDYRFSDKKGRVFSYSYQPGGLVADPPLTFALIDFDGGGRILSEMTDRDVSQLRVGMPLEMTFRRMRIPPDIHDYFWKCRPLRVRRSDGEH
jgi:hydroxymethylglutaryl-CoA synthase